MKIDLNYTIRQLKEALTTTLTPEQRAWAQDEIQKMEQRRQVAAH